MNALVSSSLACQLTPSQVGGVLSSTWVWSCLHGGARSKACGRVRLLVPLGQVSKSFRRMIVTKRTETRSDQRTTRAGQPHCGTGRNVSDDRCVEDLLNALTVIVVAGGAAVLAAACGSGDQWPAPRRGPQQLSDTLVSSCRHRSTQTLKHPQNSSPLYVAVLRLLRLAMKERDRWT